MSLIEPCTGPPTINATGRPIPPITYIRFTLQKDGTYWAKVYRQGIINIEVVKMSDIEVRTMLAVYTPIKGYPQAIYQDRSVIRLFNYSRGIQGRFPEGRGY